MRESLIGNIKKPYFPTEKGQVLLRDLERKYIIKYEGAAWHDGKKYLMMRLRAPAQPAQSSSSRVYFGIHSDINGRESFKVWPGDTYITERVNKDTIPSVVIVEFIAQFYWLNDTFLWHRGKITVKVGHVWEPLLQAILQSYRK